MASTPGILTRWPWEPLGNFKYIIVVPGTVHSIYSFIVKGEHINLYFFTFPLMLWRMLHNQIWISLSRYRTAKGKKLIVDRSLEFEQVDREQTWDDQIVLNWIMFYLAYWRLEMVRNLPLWRADGLLLIFVLHAGPVEFLYYWFHRALHHHFLYSRYHSHHHSSIVTEPITSTFTGTNSLAATAIYITYIDFMNNMGHCNYEFMPKWLFTIFPPLKYLIYTPSYHSLHHTQFRTNYSLFMPLYDYIYGTMDKSTDSLYENCLKKPEDVPDVVHLTHLTTPQSVYHLRLGFASLASNPLSSKWYLWLMWPVTLWSMIVAWVCGRPFVVERNTFKKLKLQSWVIPRYSMHYLSQWSREGINSLIEEAILDAEDKGIKVVSLGLLNQREHLNKHGEIYLERHPNLKVKVVDGSSLAVAVVINNIPKRTSQVLIRGTICKVASSIVSALYQKGIQVSTIRKDEFDRLKKVLTKENGNNNLALTTAESCNQKVWLVGEDLTESEQLMAPKGTLFIPFSQFSPKQKRKDCFYLKTPALLAPKSFGNLHSCENWLPRRVLSAWRVAGIVHALEGWNVNECGDNLLDIDKVWEATLQHGFRPILD